MGQIGKRNEEISILLIYEIGQYLENNYGVLFKSTRNAWGVVLGNWSRTSENISTPFSVPSGSGSQHIQSSAEPLQLISKLILPRVFYVYMFMIKMLSWATCNNCSRPYIY